MISCLVGAFTSVPFSPPPPLPVLPHYAFISLDTLFIFYFRSTFGALLISYLIFLFLFPLNTPPPQMLAYFPEIINWLTNSWREGSASKGPSYSGRGWKASSGYPRGWPQIPATAVPGGRTPSSGRGSHFTHDGRTCRQNTHAFQMKIFERKCLKITVGLFLVVIFLSLALCFAVIGFSH